MTNRAPSPAASPDGDPWLLTPGPATTSSEVKRAMLHDWGCWDRPFIELTRGVLDRLVEVAGGAGGGFEAVPVQGSGTFGVEAMLGTFVPRDAKTLVLANGAYGRRVADTLRVIGRDHTVLEGPEHLPIGAEAVAEALAADPSIGHVVVVHCETTSGLLNPVEGIAEAVARAGRRLLVDAMSSFGALPLDIAKSPVDAIVASSNKCFEGAPGFAFVVARKTALEAAKGAAHSLSLDLHDQWVYLRKTGRWRFTPPTHVVAAFAKALEAHAAEGGVAGRGARYAANHRALVRGMRGLGLKTLVADAHQSPIITTFLSPADPAYSFDAFYERLSARGFIIYPGKMTDAETFRIGTIGRLTPEVVATLIQTVDEVLREMGVETRAPARDAA